jgi:hypothetical protein
MNQDDLIESITKWFFYKGKYAVHSIKGQYMKMTVPHDFVRKMGLKNLDKLYVYFTGDVMIISKEKIEE